MKTSTKPTSPLRYGIIGFGRFARRRIIPAFQQITDSSITAIQKRKPGEAAIEAESLGISTGYDSYEELLADSAVDVVYITSANHDHTEHAIASAKAGKHVLCEKPLANTPAACEKIIAACAQAGVKLMVAQTLRYSAPVMLLKQWISAGKLGKISSARACFTYLLETSPRSWIRDKQMAGGGPLADLGVHCIDTLRYLSGTVREAVGFTSPKGQENDIELSAEGLLHFEDGVTGSFFCSYQTPYWNRLAVWGEAGHAWVEPCAPPGTDVELKFRDPYGEIAINRINTGNPYGKLIKAFSDAICHDTDVPISGSEGLINQQIISSVYAGNHYRRA
ncbi:Gfo/Idh/MocA family oxidoreductase [bacterium]|nr:Gfo/Idh/MocA family oxidoreductase [bacterium]MBU1651643.1 Gfo/Idh/MocA family oxidoreductase [bacterium]MBU1881312.1 Gfo/Idh/MocA family oxidoreductase [bacterium]